MSKPTTIITFFVLSTFLIVGTDLLLNNQYISNIFRKYSEVDSKFSKLPYIPEEYMPKLKIISKGITPSNIELDENNRARSARLRIVEKIKD